MWFFLSPFKNQKFSLIFVNFRLPPPFCTQKGGLIWGDPKRGPWFPHPFLPIPQFLEPFAARQALRRKKQIRPLLDKWAVDDFEELLKVSPFPRNGVATGSGSALPSGGLCTTPPVAAGAWVGRR